MTIHLARRVGLFLFFLALFTSALRAQNLTATPGSLNFIAAAPGATVSPQTIALGVTNGQTSIWGTILPIQYGPSPNGLAGSQNWLSVLTQNSSSAPVNVSVGVTTANLINGNYTATLLFGGTTLSSQVSVPVNLCVGPTCTASSTLTPSSFTFSTGVGGTAQSGALTITSAGASTWNAPTPTTTDGASWLSVNPTSGNFANSGSGFSGSTSTTTVTANPTGLAAGTYTGTVTITSGTTQSTASVTFNVGVSAASSTLILSTASMLFQGAINASLPRQQLLILDDGHGGLAWTSTIIPGTCGSALSLVDTNGNTITGGTTPTTAFVTITGLSSNTCSATVVISATNSINKTVSTSITVNQAASTGKTLSAKTSIGGLSALNFIGNAGSAIGAQTLAISDSGGGGIAWNAAPSVDGTASAAWLSTNPTFGTTNGTTNVTVNTAGLAGGSYTGTLTFMGVGIAAPVQVPVALTLSAPAALTVSPVALTFAAAVGSSTPPATQTVLVGATQSTNFTYTAVSNQSWLTVSPQSGATFPATTMTVTANPAGLQQGTYTATITISAGPSGSQPAPASQLVNVTFVISGLPVLTVNTNSLSFTGTAGSTIATQSLQVSSTGGVLSYTGVAAVSTPSNGNWLQLTGASGSTPGSITVAAVTTGLSAGTYTGTITINASGSGNAQVVNVTLTVTPGATLTATPASLTFTGAPGGSIAPQTISIANTNTAIGAVTWNATAAVTTPANGNWLTVTPSTGTTPSTAQVVVSPLNLPISTTPYTGTITISSPGAGNTVVINVSLTVTAASVTVSTNTLTFTGTSGGVIAAQTVTIGSTGAAGLSWTAAVATQSGGNGWLAIQPSSGQTPSTMQVTATPGSLAPGTYNGTVIVSGSNGNAQTINVTLTVSSLGILALSPQSLQFLATRISPTTQSASFDVQNLGSGNLAFTATATTVTGGNWLTLSATSGVAPTTLKVTVNPIGLAAGSYIGTIAISSASSSNAVNGPVTLAVYLVVDAPAIFPGGIVNAASFANDGSASPGELMSLFGASLATATTSAGGLPLPTTLGATQVLINGTAVPLFFTAAGQINFLFPEVSGNAATVTVVSGTQKSLSTLINLSPAMPGIFTTGAQGLGMILNQDFSSNSPASPASAGQTIQIYATGLGVTFPRVQPGAGGATSSPFNNLVQVPTVTIGGITANVTFAAEAPGLSGVYQVNAVVPAGLAPGGFTVVQLSSSGKTSNPVVLAVK